MGRPEDSYPELEWDEPSPTVLDSKNPEDTAPHQSLDYMVGRERGWSEAVRRYGSVLEDALLAVGLARGEAIRVRHWCDSRVEAKS